MALGDDYGLSRALNVDLGFDQRLNDLRYNELQTKRIQAENAAKAQLFADDLNFQNAANSFDNNIIKQRNKERIQNIGRFVRENPDWNTNVEKRVQLNMMKRELADNPDTIRGFASDLSRKEYLKDLQEVAKNPQQYDTEAYSDVGRQWDNYVKFGNQFGPDAAKTEGYKAFVYSKPRDFVDMNKAFQETGNSFKDLKTRPIKGGRNAYEEYADPNSLALVANQMYAQNKRQIDLEAQGKGVAPLQYVMSGINAHIPKKRDFGDYNLSDATYLMNYKKRLDGLDREVGNNSAYQVAFVNAPEGVVAPTYLEQTYDVKPKHVLYDNKGATTVDNTGNRVYYTGAHKWIEKGGKRQKVVEIYSYLPLEDAKQKGIVDDPLGFSGSNGTDLEVSPSWNRQAEIVRIEGKDGAKPVVKVKALMPVEINQAYAGSFDNEVHIAKSKLPAQNPTENSGPETGTIFTDKNTGKSYRKVEGGYEPLD